MEEEFGKWRRIGFRRKFISQDRTKGCSELKGAKECKGGKGEGALAKAGLGEEQGSGGLPSNLKPSLSVGVPDGFLFQAKNSCHIPTKKRWKQW